MRTNLLEWDLSELHKSPGNFRPARTAAIAVLNLKDDSKTYYQHSSGFVLPLSQVISFKATSIVSLQPVEPPAPLVACRSRRANQADWLALSSYFTMIFRSIAIANVRRQTDLVGPPLEASCNFQGNILVVFLHTDFVHRFQVAAGRRIQLHGEVAAVSCPIVTGTRTVSF